MRRESGRTRGAATPGSLREVLVRAVLPCTLLILLGAEGPAARAQGPAPPAPTPPAAARGFGGLSFASGDEPITVQAEQLEFDYEKNRLVYKGSVHVVQGDFQLESQVLTVTFDRADELERAQLRRVVAQGDVVITQGERRASGRRAVFDQATRQIVLVGNPVLRDGPNEVQGNRLTVYLDEGRSVMESSPKGRVSAVLYPGQSGESAAASPGASQGSSPGASPGPSPGASPAPSPARSPVRKPGRSAPGARKERSP